MPTALHIAGLPPEPRQGVGVRLLRRLGGAVRSSAVRGITLAGSLQRAAVRRLGRQPATARAPEAPSAPMPPGAALPTAPDASAAPPRPDWSGWVARYYALRQSNPAWRGRPAIAAATDTPFTPEAFPQLSAKACRILNTPFEELHPDTVNLLFATLAQYLAGVMSGGPRERDPQALLSGLWQRITAALAAAEPDVGPAAAQGPAPEAPAVAEPDAATPSPNPPPAPPSAVSRAKSATPTTGVPVAPVPYPAALPDPPGNIPDSGIAFATLHSIPGAAARAAPIPCIPGAVPASDRSSGTGPFRDQRPLRIRRCPLRCRGTRPARSFSSRPQHRPPPRRLYYAARAGPP